MNDTPGTFTSFPLHASSVPSPSELKLTMEITPLTFPPEDQVMPFIPADRPPTSANQGSFPNAFGIPNQGSFPDAQAAPNQGSFPNAFGAPNQGSFPDAQAAPNQGSFPNALGAPNQGSFPDAQAAPNQGSFPNAFGIPNQGSFPDAQAAPNQGSFPDSLAAPPQESFPDSAPAPLPEASPNVSPAMPQGTAPAPSVSAPQADSDQPAVLDPIDSPYAGEMRINVVSALGLIPIENATVVISYTGDPENPIETLTTDSSGQTDIIELPAPPLDLSLSPSEIQPYSEYDINVTAEGYEPVFVTGSEIFADQLSLQPIRMNPLETSEEEEKVVVIPVHTLFGNFPPKIPEDEIKPMAETGEIVLSRVVIPEYVIVHDGVPMDPTAPNYWVRYKDYIKNVASCEIYSTWNEAALYANILAIQSFTLNRVFTEWYRNQGYDFTITTSTAYDQKWVYGRNIYENIDYLVDTIFANFLSRPGVRQPIFTSYCDGRRVTCDGLSQWGSQYLAQEGYSAIEIIRYYYGNDMYINSADVISGVPSSWPGYDLTIGSAGDKVRQLQTQLNRIARNYPAIPTVVADGIYGPATAEAIRIFQGIFNLPQTGITDYATWYEVSDIYVGVTRIAEPG